MEGKWGVREREGKGGRGEKGREGREREGGRGVRLPLSKFLDPPLGEVLSFWRILLNEDIQYVHLLQLGIIPHRS